MWQWKISWAICLLTWQSHDIMLKVKKETKLYVKNMITASEKLNVSASYMKKSMPRCVDSYGLFVFAFDFLLFSDQECFLRRSSCPTSVAFFHKSPWWHVKSLFWPFVFHFAFHSFHMWVFTSVFWENSSAVFCPVDSAAHGAWWGLQPRLLCVVFSVLPVPPRHRFLSLSSPYVF